MKWYPMYMHTVGGPYRDIGYPIKSKSLNQFIGSVNTLGSKLAIIDHFFSFLFSTETSLACNQLFGRYLCAKGG